MLIELNQIIAGMLLLLNGYADDFDIKFAIERMKNAGFTILNEKRLCAGYSAPELDNKNSAIYFTKKAELESIATNQVIEFLTSLNQKELILRKFNLGSRTIYQNITPGIINLFQEGYLNFDFDSLVYSISDKGKDYLKTLEGTPRERK